MFKSGTIAIVGRPNVGKSTLLNAFLGEKLAAVTSKPQTTRHRILGIKNLQNAQLLFVDTPGIHEPHKTLNQVMVEAATAALEEADLFLFVVEPILKSLEADRKIYETVRSKGKPILLVINKVDQASREALPAVMDGFREFPTEGIFPVSALHGKGLEALLEATQEKLPEGPHYFPEDQLTDLSERFLASEVIREKATTLTHAEVPYSLAVEIEDFREPREEDLKKLVRIRASIIVEKDSQKGILIGKGGVMIKRIGSEARVELEGRLGQRVYLELFVRVEPDWTKDSKKVREFTRTS